jgi:uncharacterized protein (TIGR02679 family)
VNAAPEKLRAIFSATGWSRFIDTLAQYRDRGRSLPAAVTLPAPTEDERRHHARLLRLPTPSSASALRYDLVKIAAALEAAHLPADWAEILTILRGPIAADKLAAQFARQGWQMFWPQAAATLDRHPFPSSHEWLDSLRRDGTLRRLSKGDVALAAQWIERGARLLHALPISEEQPLASVAARYGGDSHALDPASVLSTLVLRGLALRIGQAAPSRSDERRKLWAAFRVVCDELSAPVLTFNLGLGGDALLCRLIALASAETQPLHLTSRLLWATEWARITCLPEVFVCENPTIVSLAATQLGHICPPLVCVDGEPKTAARLLLRRLRAGGSTLFYHGDFDWPGLAIAERIFREFDAQPWCFDAESYHSAAARQGRPLTGRPVPTPWSPALAEVMQRTGIAYDEELLADVLLSNLVKEEARLK